MEAIGTLGDDLTPAVLEEEAAPPVEQSSSVEEMQLPVPEDKNDAVALVEDEPATPLSEESNSPGEEAPSVEVPKFVEDVFTAAPVGEDVASEAMTVG